MRVSIVAALASGGCSGESPTLSGAPSRPNAPSTTAPGTSDSGNDNMTTEVASEKPIRCHPEVKAAPPRTAQVSKSE